MNISKRIAAIAIAVVGTTAMSHAQIDEGQSDINLGIGFVTFGMDGETSFPPLSLSYEYAINDNVSVGGIVAYTASTWEPFGSFMPDAPTAELSAFIVGARGSYHKELIDDVDTYLGVFLGYNSVSAAWTDDDPNTMLPALEVGGVTYGAYAGARYHFTDNLGAFLEVGYGISAVNIGLTAKFD